MDKKQPAKREMIGTDNSDIMAAFPPPFEQAPLVPGTIPWLEMVLKQTKRTFGDLEAADVIAPPPDSDYIRARYLVGVTILVVAVDIASKSFEGSKPRDTATYKIYIRSRLELGIRMVSLASHFAVEQARSLSMRDFPFLATIELAVENKEKTAWSCVSNQPPDQNQFASAILTPPRGMPWHIGEQPIYRKPNEETYYHNPLGEYSPAQLAQRANEERPF